MSHTWCTIGENLLTAKSILPTSWMMVFGAYDGGNVEKQTIGLALNALTMVAILFAALYGSWDATISLTTASPSSVRPATEIDPWRQCNAFVDLMPAACYVVRDPPILSETAQTDQLIPL